MTHSLEGQAFGDLVVTRPPSKNKKKNQKVLAQVLATVNLILFLRETKG
jgi:hypothetical protein